MAFTVRLAEPVRAYLRTLAGLSREGRLKLLAGILGLLRDHGERASLRLFKTPGIRLRAW